MRTRQYVIIERHNRNLYPKNCHRRSIKNEREKNDGINHPKNKHFRFFSINLCQELCSRAHRTNVCKCVHVRVKMDEHQKMRESREHKTNRQWNTCFHDNILLSTERISQSFFDVLLRSFSFHFIFIFCWRLTVTKTSINLRWIS